MPVATSCVAVDFVSVEIGLIVRESRTNTTRCMV